MRLGLGGSLKERRAACGLTQQEVAYRVVSSQSRIARMESADSAVSIVSPTSGEDLAKPSSVAGMPPTRDSNDPPALIFHEITAHADQILERQVRLLPGRFDESKTVDGGAEDGLQVVVVGRVVGVCRKKARRGERGCTSRVSQPAFRKARLTGK